MKYTIYTDGVADNFVAPHYGGYAWRAVDENGEFTEGCGCTENTTGNRMAMIAIVAALGTIEEGSECVVFTNNQYATFPFSNRKGKYKANLDLVHDYWAIVDTRKLKCKVQWKKTGTDPLLDEMRDLSLAQFYEVSDKEFTNPLKFKHTNYANKRTDYR